VTRVGFKARLTLWHAAATTAILLVAAVSADWLLARAVFSQLDAALLVIGETEAGSALDNPAGVHLHDLDASADPASLRLNRLDKLVQIIDNRGAVLLRNATLRDSELPAPASLVARLCKGETVLETTSWNDGEPIRLLTLPISVAGSYPFAVQVGTSLRPTYAFLRTARVLWLVRSIAVLAAVIASVAAANGEAVLSIADSGPGIPAAHLPRIFDRFFRGDPARSGDVPGFGLGLSICRTIADRYHGVIEMVPNPAGGSVFSARLPLASSGDDHGP
jgi:two-component system OmpR family sensor kinase